MDQELQDRIDEVGLGILCDYVLSDNEAFIQMAYNFLAKIPADEIQAALDEIQGY